MCIRDRYERMRNHSRLITECNSVKFSEERSLNFCIINIRSHEKHSIDIKMDQSLNKNNLIFFTETQLKSDSELSSIEIDLPNYHFQHNFSDNHRFSSLATANDRNAIMTTLQKLDGASLYSLSLMLSWSCTVHKVQGKQFPQVVFSFQLLKQRRFNTGQVYVALSRATSLKGLYLTGELNENQ